MLRSWCRGGRSRHQLSVIIQTPVESCNFFNAFIVQLRYVSSDLKPRPSVWESSDKKTLHAELQTDFQEVDSPEMKPAPRWEAAELLPVFLLAPSLWRLQAVRTPRIFSSDYNRVYLPSSRLIHLPASCSARYSRSASVALSTNNRAETETSEEQAENRDASWWWWWNWKERWYTGSPRRVLTPDAVPAAGWVLFPSGHRSITQHAPLIKQPQSPKHTNLWVI